MSKHAKYGLMFLVLLLLSLPAAWAFFQPGFPITDDGNWMIIRLSSFYEEFKHGQFPVRWLGRLNQGYGYPVANFLYPGFLYLGVPLVLVLSSFVTTVKVLFASSLIASSIGAYLWLSQRFGKWASMIGALVYLYAPYHLFDATVRGSLGEVLVLALLPFVLWSIEKRFQSITAISIGLLLISHNTLAILFLPIILLYQAIILREKKQLRDISQWLPVSFGIGLSAFFWLPAIADLKSTVFAQTKISNYAEFFASRGQIGLMAFIATVGGLSLGFFRLKNSTSAQKTLGVMFLGLSLLTLFLSSSLSWALWQILPVQFIQFPFRFLSITLISTAFLSAWTISLVKWRIFVGVVGIFVIALSASPYLIPREHLDVEEGYYTTNQATTTIKDEYMPRWVTTPPTHQAAKRVILRSGKLTIIEDKSHKLVFRTEASSSQVVTVNTLYFPGWQATLDGQKRELLIAQATGLMEVSVPKGTHQVQLELRETPLRLVADGMSLISILGIAVLLLKTKRL